MRKGIMMMLVWCSHTWKVHWMNKVKGMSDEQNFWHDVWVWMTYTCYKDGSQNTYALITLKAPLIYLLHVLQSATNILPKCTTTFLHNVMYLNKHFHHFCSHLTLPNASAIQRLFFVLCHFFRVHSILNKHAG
jgi:hypothetical protein